LALLFAFSHLLRSRRQHHPPYFTGVVAALEHSEGAATRTGHALLAIPLLADLAGDIRYVGGGKSASPWDRFCTLTSFTENISIPPTHLLWRSDNAEGKSSTRQR
jgi:hypothetical protein